MSRRGSPVEPPEALREQLRVAMSAAQAAYQDSTRLIRLLTVLGRPGAPDEIVDETLTVLSEVYQADVTCLARLVDDRLVVTAACGLPETDPAFTAGWVPSPAAAQALLEGRPVASSGPDLRPRTGPHVGTDGDTASVHPLSLRSAVWLPLAEEPDGPRIVRHLLILYRSDPTPFTGTELALLVSVAERLQTSVQARHRRVALERLARSGHVLLQHRRQAPLLQDAARLLRELVGAMCAAVVTVEDGVVTPGIHAAPGCPTQSWLTAMDGAPAAALPGWQEIKAGRPRFVEVREPEGTRSLLVVPAGPQGAPSAVLYARWADLPPLMSPVTETSAILASHLSAALVNVSLYRALSRSEASLRLITDSVGDLIAVIDPSGRFTYASASYGRVVAHSPASLAGRPVLDLVQPEDRSPVQAALLTCRSTSTSTTTEYRLVTGDGRAVWAESVLRPADAPDGNMVMSTRLIEDRKRREDELLRLAAHDPLTGLANRSRVIRQLEEALADDTGDVGVLFCDLDKFKQVNDELGHAAGDELLQQVAERLRRCTRSGDLIARLGGDEFVFVLEGIIAADEVAYVGRRIAQSMEPPFQLAGKPVAVSVSVGAAIATAGEATAAALLAAADRAMYEAKRRGNELQPEAIVRVRDRG